MAIPDFQKIMLPLLQVVSDGKEYRLGNVITILATQFQLTEADLKELLPSGRQARFNNRVGWAQTYMKKAGLLEGTGKNGFHITARGTEILQSKPKSMNTAFLKQFPEFVEFAHGSPGLNGGPPPESGPIGTPEEVLESTFQALQKELAHDLLERVKKGSPAQFEQLIVDLLVAMGYGGSRKEAGQAVGKSGDGGIDGIIKEDRLGLDNIYLQAKKWESTVGTPDVHKFAGALDGAKARKGVLISTSKFSQPALDYVKHIEKRIVLIDGDMLVQLMIQHGIGVAEIRTYTLKRADIDYFDVDEPSISS